VNGQNLSRSQVLHLLELGLDKFSIRDHFAAQVLPEVYRASIDLGNDDQSAIASECYELADAMLEARDHSS
jgi:hypothetical protein